MARNRASLPVIGVSVILALQTIALWVVAAVLVFDTATQPSDSLAGAIFLDVMIVGSAVAMSIAGVLFLRGVASTRAAIVVWQMTVIGIGIASAQGTEPRWDLAAVMVIPAAVVTIFMLFNREVSRHLNPDA